MDSESPRRRAAPRAPLHYECFLKRAKGGPIACTTLDLGPGGMRVTTSRPLSVDELVAFDLPLAGMRIDGQARVLREQGFNVYALRFERLPNEAAGRLGDLALAAA